MKKFLTRLFAVITIFATLAYFISCLTPYISPVTFWPMAFFALGFPYLAVVIIILAISWLFVKRKYALFLLLLLFAGFQNLFATFALNPSAPKDSAKEPTSLRILTWNVRGFDNPGFSADSGTSIRKRMYDYIKKTNPDVMCFQEFAEHLFPGVSSNTKELQKLGYIYYYRTDELPHRYVYGTILTGSAIFSKVPIINRGQIRLGDSSYQEHLVYTDVMLQNQKVRIFTTHFKSINLFAKPEDSDNKVIFHGDSNFVYRSTQFEKLKVFGQDHARQSLIVKKALNASPFPVVFTGDLNSVPTSYPYHMISSGLQDAFRLSGWGLGTTLDSLPKTLRIDFFFADKRLRITNYRKDDLPLSDHFPQIVDIGLQE